MTLSAALEDDMLSAAGELSGERVLGAQRVHGGGNSEVYRIDCEGRRLALKRYPHFAGDGRDRVGVEMAALEFLWAEGLRDQPRAVAMDAERRIALIEWIDGEPVNPVNAAEIEAATAYLARLHRLRDAPGAAALPLASEACLSGAEVVRQVEARLSRLSQAAASSPDLGDFLDSDLSPCCERFADRCRRGFADAAIPFDADLPHDLRTLSPSDFGFHNALRRRDGRIVFLDFEYFGWDDPVKLAADFILHPARRLDGRLKRQFLAACERLYGADRNFGDRLTLLYPLYGLRWCAIILNPFLRAPDATNGEARAIRGERFARARELLEELRKTDGTLAR